MGLPWTNRPLRTPCRTGSWSWHVDFSPVHMHDRTVHCLEQHQQRRFQTILWLCFLSFLPLWHRNQTPLNFYNATLAWGWLRAETWALQSKASRATLLFELSPISAHMAQVARLHALLTCRRLRMRLEMSGRDNSCPSFDLMTLLISLVFVLVVLAPRHMQNRADSVQRDVLSYQSAGLGRGDPEEHEHDLIILTLHPSASYPGTWSEAEGKPSRHIS